MLVHGSMDRGASFARVAPLLVPHRVVRYDRRGYGRSLDPGAPAATVDEHADDLLAVIDEHADGRAVVIGHSLGAAIVLIAACRRPRAVLAVGAYEMPMPWEPWWAERSAGGDTIAEADAHGAGAGAERFLRRMLGDERWEALTPAEQEARRAEGPALVAELRTLRGDGGGPPFDVDALRCPVRTARGSQSKPHHQRGADELAQLVGDHHGPTVIEGAQHGAHRSHPKEFAAWVGDVAAAQQPA